MKASSRAFACVVGLAAASLVAHAGNHSVFALHGSNSFETMSGALILNRDAVRSVTATGFSFASPVDFLHYTVRDDSGVITSFTLSERNPNTLWITKGADGSTRFFLLVEPVPTDPPFPSPPAFIMEFSFPGAAPWGDYVPDRTITGATNVSLGANDLYDQSVSITEVMVNELARELGSLNAELKRLRKHLSKGSGN